MAAVVCAGHGGCAPHDALTSAGGRAFRIPKEAVGAYVGKTMTLQREVVDTGRALHGSQQRSEFPGSHGQAAGMTTRSHAWRGVAPSAITRLDSPAAGCRHVRASLGAPARGV